MPHNTWKYPKPENMCQVSCAKYLAKGVKKKECLTFLKFQIKQDEVLNGPLDMKILKIA